MRISILFSLFITISSLISPLNADSQTQKKHVFSINCAPRLQKALHTIYQLEEARELVHKVYQEGAISIDVQNTELSNQFGAFWDQERRIICISVSPRTTEAEIIASIIFELHNASVSAKFEQLDHLASNGQITRERYIESVEYLEYLNSLAAATIAEKGIQAGLFPPSARLFTYKNFEEHFHYQKIGGHSSWVGKVYDQLYRS